MISNSRILHSGILLFSTTIIVKWLAFLKEIIVAQKFGMNQLTDAFNVAFLIPSVLLYVVGVTVLTGIPSSIFSRSIANHNRIELSQTFSTVFNLYFSGTLVITALCIWYMPAILKVYAHNLDTENFVLAVFMGRILITMLVTFGLSQFLSSSLNAFRSYVVPGISFIIAYSCIIIILLSLSDKYGITSLAIGTAVGFFLSFAIQFIFIVKSKIDYKFNLNIKLPAVRGFIAASVPLMILDITNQICVLIDRKVALGLFDGAFSALMYAARINEIGINLFVLPLMTVLLPEFSRDSALNNIVSLKSRMKFNVEVLAAIVIFWVVFFLVFYKEIVAFCYMRGEFTIENALITGNILLINIIGFVFQAGYLFLLYVYLGLQKTRSLAVIGSIAYCINILFIFILTPVLGVYGLAIATSIMSFVYCVFLYTVLKLRYLRFRFFINASNLFKIIGLGLIFGLGYSVVYNVFNITISMGTMDLAAFIGGAFLGGAILYMVMLKMLNVFSFQGIFGRFRE